MCALVVQQSRSTCARFDHPFGSRAHRVSILQCVAEASGPFPTSCAMRARENPRRFHPQVRLALVRVDRSQNCAKNFQIAEDANDGMVCPPMNSHQVTGESASQPWYATHGLGSTGMDVIWQ